MTTLIAVGVCLLTIFFVESTIQACDSGWFGPDCQYMCHCTDNACDDLGQCQGNTACERGWFGPACQYRDMAVGDFTSVSAGLTGREQVNVEVLFDGKGDTCIDIPDLTYIILESDTAYHVKWLRFISESPVSPEDFLVYYKQSPGPSVIYPVINCDKSENASISDTIVDIYCYVDVPVRQIAILRSGIRNLCTIHIDGGRNVALKANMSQSSTWPTAVSGRAVDGNTDGDLYRGKSCSSTLKRRNPIWEMTFSQSHTVNRFIVHNRDDGTQGRLKRFILRSYNKTGNEIFQHIDTTAKVQIIYTIVPATEIHHVSTVTISIQKTEILSLCEVQVFGETECPLGTFGFTCNNTCNCAVEEEACFVSTGACPSGCAVGFFGEGCAHECPEGRFGIDCRGKCVENCIHCNRQNGHCDICIYGKQGNDCSEDCPNLLYGPNCKFKCSRFCAFDGSCDPTNGTCLSGCTAGYQGPECRETCDDGRYGANCRYSCSETCNVDTLTEPSICHRETGKCLSGCEQGTYGDDCSSICSIHCIVNGTADVCHRTTGKCLLGCFNNTDEPECISSAASSGSLSLGPIVGAIVGVLFLVGVIVLVVFLWRRRHSRNEDGVHDHSNGESTQPDNRASEDNYFNSLDESNAEEERGEIRNTQYNYISMDDVSSTVIALRDLDKYIESHDRKFFQHQFKKVPKNNRAMSLVGLRPENNDKNRYGNIIAYDHSRVSVGRQTSTGEGAYINASYITGFQGERLIATQGPSKNTVSDFILMLWEQEVDAVVMLTNLERDAKDKCEQYWPDDEKPFGDIRVKAGSTHVFADYTIRKISLAQSEETRILTQFHFTSWPEKGVPTTPWSLVDFEQRVAAAKSSDKPVVVHCGAGVGRTGTFIALRNLVKEAEVMGQVDFFTAVADLRKDRPNMVQTLDQYIFLHTAVQVAMTCAGTTLTSRDIANRIKTLDETNSAGIMNLEKEFERLCVASVINNDDHIHYQDSDAHGYVNCRIVNASAKNRIGKQLTHCKDKTLHEENDNIKDIGLNAVFAPSFTRQRHQIVAQLPQSSTVTDFWRFVIENNVAVIVAFDLDIMDQSPPVGDYLPRDNESKCKDNYIITSGPTVSNKYWDGKEITVARSKTMTPIYGETVSKQYHEHTVIHFKCKHPDLDHNKLLALIQKVRSCKISGSGVVLYMCRDGATYSGLVCVLRLLLDRLDNDNRLTVPLVVGAIKAIRPQVIPTLEQYRVLYRVLGRYIETKANHAQFQASSLYNNINDE